MKKKLVLLVVFTLLLCFSSSVWAKDYPISERQTPSSVPDYADRIPAQDEWSVTLSDANSYPIADAGDLRDFRDQVNQGNTTLNGYLMANIDLKSENWVPIGTSTNPYRGTFDGNGFRIEGLYVPEQSTGSVGLFAFTDGALIENLGILGEIHGGTGAAGIVGNGSDTTIANCYNKCSVKSSRASAGIAFILTGESAVISCYNKGNISDTNSQKDGFNGGIVGIGADDLVVAFCYNTGNISSPGNVAGGIAGGLGENVLLVSSYNAGSISSSGSSGNIAGFVTDVAGIANCYYLTNSLDGIGSDGSSYDHDMYYGSSAALKNPDTVNLLNGADSYFMVDIYNINNGYPILTWERPVPPSYNITVSSGVDVSKNRAEPGEVIQLLTLKENFEGWVTTPHIEISSTEVDQYIYGLFTMPDSNVTITAKYKTTIVFSDVPQDAWYADVVYDLVNKGIIAGKGNNIFDPNNNVTRGEFAKILAAATLSEDELNANYNGAAAFNDSNNWAKKYINWAASVGVVNGTGNNNFSPNANISRQDMAVMIARYAANVQKITLPEKNPAITFRDDDQIASYAKEAVAAMQKAGIINGRGDNLFAPRANATRAEACKMIYGYLNL